jgi:ABC-type multidrug transport system fused ATPase/permease subunit
MLIEVSVHGGRLIRIGIPLRDHPHAIASLPRPMRARRRRRRRRRSIAESSLSAIRTVKQCGGEALARGRYAAALRAARAAATRGGALAGVGFAVMSGTVLAFFGLALWFGGWLVARGESHGGADGGAWTAGDVVAVLFAQITGAMALGQIQPPLSAVLQAPAPPPPRPPTRP